MSDSFVFFRLMYETGMDIEDEKTRLEYFEALCLYGLDGTPPPPHLKAYLRGAMYSIDKKTSRANKISDSMQGNSNAVKDWEKVSKQMKTDENRGEQIKQMPYISKKIEDRSIEDKKNEEKEINKNEEKEINKNEEKKERYLDFVLLTQSEHARLVNKFGLTKTQRLMEELNSYIGQIGVGSASKKYKSHYFTILNRERREGGKTTGDYAKQEALAKHREKVREQIDQYLHPNDSTDAGLTEQNQTFDRRGQILSS